MGLYGQSVLAALMCFYLTASSGYQVVKFCRGDYEDSDDTEEDRRFWWEGFITAISVFLFSLWIGGLLMSLSRHVQ